MRQVKLQAGDGYKEEGMRRSWRPLNPNPDCNKTKSGSVAQTSRHGKPISTRGPYYPLFYHLANGAGATTRIHHSMSLPLVHPSTQRHIIICAGRGELGFVTQKQGNNHNTKGRRQDETRTREKCWYSLSVVQERNELCRSWVVSAS